MRVQPTILDLSSPLHYKEKGEYIDDNLFLHQLAAASPEWACSLIHSNSCWIIRPFLFFTGKMPLGLQLMLQSYSPPI